jgi:8-amino-7-oxononanoate synthase
VDFSAELSALQAQSLLRRRPLLDGAPGARLNIDGKDYLAFASNDYLGLAHHPALIAAAQQAAVRWGVGGTASHLVAGHFTPHEQLEQELAGFVGLPAALLFSSGYMANLGVLTCLLQRGDAVFADKLNHASLNDACLLARAEFKRFRHNDLAQLQTLLAASTARRKVIAVDAVFSMDGDFAPLADLLHLAEACMMPGCIWTMRTALVCWGHMGRVASRIGRSTRRVSSTWPRWARPPGWLALLSPGRLI